jgi:hypothetical protein
MFGNNAVPKGGFNAFKAPQRPATGGDTQYAGGAPSRPTAGQPAGQAQSTPTPSKGTPYSAYTPNSSSSYATNTDGVNRTYNTNTYNNAASGNFGNNPYSRPAPVSQGATGLGGQQFSDPSQAFAQRDAMIDRLNNSKSQYTANAGVYQGDGPPPASFGQRPQYDFNNLMGQANDMVQQGWTNPFSQPAGGLSQTAPSGGFPTPPPSYGQQVMTGQSGAAYYPVRSLPRPGEGAYYPGGPGGFPPPETGLRSADDSPTSPEYQQWRSQQVRTMEWRGPEGEAKREADLHRRWLEETGRAPASGDFRPPPQRPGNAQPISQPPQGSSYNPGQPTSQPVWSNKLGRNLTAEETAAYEEGNRRAEAERDPAEQARRRKMYAEGVYFKPPPTTGYSPGRVASTPPAAKSPSSAQPPAGNSPGFDPRIHGYNPGMPAQQPVPGPAAPPPNAPPSSPAAPSPPRRMPSWHVGGSGQSPLEAELEAKTKASMESPEWKATVEASRPGSAQPIAPPAQGDPYSVGDLTKLPFYKSLMVGDTVRLNERGQYNVFDSSGKWVNSYGNASQKYGLTGQLKGGRTGTTMWAATPEGAAEQAADLKRIEERDRPAKEAFQKETAAKLARLGELRKKQLEWAQSYGKTGNTKGLVKLRDGKYGTPWQDEYRDLLNWSSKAKYDPNLTPQQRGLIEGWFGSSAKASLSPSQVSALEMHNKIKRTKALRP